MSPPPRFFVTCGQDQDAVARFQNSGWWYRLIRGCVHPTNRKQVNLEYEREGIANATDGSSTE